MPPIVEQDLIVARRYLSLLALFDRVLPHARLVSVLAPWIPATRRERLLPAEITLQLVIAMNLYARDALTLVLSKLFLAVGLEQTSQVALPCSSAITQARQRLGIGPVHALFHQLCVPLATPATPSAFLGGLRLMAIDASTEVVADTPANTRAFGKHHNQYGSSAFPLVQVVYLLECGTHAIIDAMIRPGHAHPLDLARRLVRSVRPDMLVLLDRGLTQWPVLACLQERGAPVLGRVQDERLLPPLRGYPDGSYLARFYRDPPSRRTARTPFVLVRVLVYTLDLPDWPQVGQTSRLITTLLDADQYPARTLIAAYHERWEIEVAIDEVDTHLRPVGRPLRSKTPQLVIQEFFGLLIAHYLVRAEMLAAGTTTGHDPDRLSFTHAIGIVQQALPLAQLTSATGRRHLHDRISQILVRYHLPPRERRSNPRVVRRKSSKFPRKASAHHGVSLRTPFLDAICPSGMGAALRPRAAPFDPLPVAA